VWRPQAFRACLRRWRYAKTEVFGQRHGGVLKRDRAIDLAVDELLYVRIVGLSMSPFYSFSLRVIVTTAKVLHALHH
jgi:hypothetical protein